MLSLNADGKQVTYLLLRGYQWVNFYDAVAFKHHVYYVIGATRRRDGTLTYRPHPSMED